MINLRAYENFNENEWKMPTKRVRAKMEASIYSYIANSENFPEMDNIKNIFEDISDYCYLNNLGKPMYEKGIYSLKDNEIDPISRMHFNRILSSIFYKTYIVFISHKGIVAENIKLDLREKIETAYKRLTNYGYVVKGWHRVGSSKREYTSLYILDTKDSLTFKEIIQAK